MVDWLNTPGGSTYETFFGLAHIALLLTAICKPQIGCMGLLALELVACIQPVTHGPSGFWGAYCAIGLLIYEKGLSAVSLLATFSFLGTQCYQVASWNHNTIRLTDMMVFLMYTAASAIVGYGFQWWSEANKQQLQQHLNSEHELQTKYHRYNSDNAIRLHDSVAQRFTGIQLIAQDNLHRQISDDERKSWRTIDDLACKGLHETRLIIDMMTNDTADDDDSAQSSEWWPAIQRMADQGDSMLHAQGYAGKTELMDGGIGATQVNDGDLRTLGMMLNELYANIIKHAAPHSEYQASVTLRKTGMEIVMSNEIEPHPAGHTIGRGLRSRARKLELIGGELDYAIDDDMFVIYARIPLSQG